MKQSKKKVPLVMTEVYLRFKGELTVEEIQRVVVGWSMTLPPELDAALQALKIGHVIFDFDEAPTGEIFRKEEIKEKMDRSYIG